MCATHSLTRVFGEQRARACANVINKNSLTPHAHTYRTCFWAVAYRLQPSKELQSHLMSTNQPMTITAIADELERIQTVLFRLQRALEAMPDTATLHRTQERSNGIVRRQTRKNA